MRDEGYSALSLSWSLVMIPVLLILQFLFTLGLGYILSVLNVFVRDTQHLVGVGVVVGIGVKIGVGVTVGGALGADYFKSLSHTTTNVVVSDDFLLVGSSQISPVMMNSSPPTAFEGTSAW